MAGFLVWSLLMQRKGGRLKSDEGMTHLLAKAAPEGTGHHPFVLQ